MQNPAGRDVLADETTEALPVEPVTLTSPQESLPPGAADLSTKAVQSFEVGRNCVIREVSAQDSCGRAVYKTLTNNICWPSCRASHTKNDRNSPNSPPPIGKPLASDLGSPDGYAGLAHFLIFRAGRRHAVPVDRSADVHISTFSGDR